MHLYECKCPFDTSEFPSKTEPGSICAEAISDFDEEAAATSAIFEVLFLLSELSQFCDDHETTVARVIFLKRVMRQTEYRIRISVLNKQRSTDLLPKRLLSLPMDIPKAEPGVGSCGNWSAS
jgi:hypothetical protein